MKHMNHNITIVEQNPAPFIEPLNAYRQGVMLFLETEVDRIGGCFDLAV